jgi:hypothetical protein
MSIEIEEIEIFEIHATLERSDDPSWMAWLVTAVRHSLGNRGTAHNRQVI